MPERPAVPSDTLPTSWLRPEIPALNLRLNFPLQPTPKHVLPAPSPNSKIKVLADTYTAAETIQFVQRRGTMAIGEACLSLPLPNSITLEKSLTAYVAVSLL